MDKNLKEKERELYQKFIEAEKEYKKADKRQYRFWKIWTEESKKGYGLKLNKANKQLDIAEKNMNKIFKELELIRKKRKLTYTKPNKRFRR